MQFDSAGFGNQNVKIIGIGHSSRVGKDTLAKYLIEEFSDEGIKACRIGFADELKKVAYLLCSQYGIKTKDHYETNPDDRYRKLDKVKKTPIEVWCSLGDGLREILYRDIWIDRLFEQVGFLGCDVVIISDVRYMNEVDAIREYGGTIIRIKRESTNGKATHIDKNLDEYIYEDERFQNDGKISKIQEYAKDFARRFIKQHRLDQISNDCSGE